MAPPNAHSATIHMFRESFEALLDDYRNPGRDDAGSVVVDVTSPGERSSHALMRFRNGVSVMISDASSTCNNPAFALPSSIARVDIRSVGEDAEMTANDLLGLAGLTDFDMLVGEEIWGSVPELNLMVTEARLHSAPMSQMESVCAATLWACHDSRTPIVLVHSREGIEEAVRQADSVRSLLSPFSRDYATVLPIDNQVRKYLRNVLSDQQDEEVAMPYDNAVVLRGIPLTNALGEMRNIIVAEAKTPSAKPDGRKILRALAVDAEEAPMFSTGVFSTLMRANPKPAPDSPQATAEEQVEAARQAVADAKRIEHDNTVLEGMLAAREREIARLRKEMRALHHEVDDLRGDMTDDEPRKRPSIAAPSGENPRPERVDLTTYNRLMDEDLPDTMAALCDLARERLSYVVLPSYVDGPAVALDDHKETDLWIGRTWRLLAAMEAFAIAGRDEVKGRGTFRAYCESLPVPPINPAHIVLKESQFVTTNARMRGERTFPVPKEVDESGTVFMPAHARVTASGSPPAPRMYWHDDTRGETGMVHVGYIGEHLTNTHTN